MAFTYVPVVGTYEYEDGTPATGTVKIEAPRPITNDGTTFTSITVTLVNGQIPGGTQVPAFNDVGTYPFVEQGYKITETLDGKSSYHYRYVRNTDGVVDLGETLVRPEESGAAAVATHEAKADPHPVYATDADLAGKADVNHTHSGYAAANHDHDADYAAIDHDHDGDYASIDHNHDGDYAPVGHLHALDISDITGLQDALNALDQRLTAIEGNG